MQIGIITINAIYIKVKIYNISTTDLDLAKKILNDKKDDLQLKTRTLGTYVVKGKQNFAELILVCLFFPVSVTKPSN